jgi:competence protein ComEC
MHPLAAAIALCLPALCFACKRSSKQAMLIVALFALGFACLTIHLKRYNAITRSIQNKTLSLQATIETVEPAQHQLYRYIITAQVTTATTDHEEVINTPWRIQLFSKSRPTFEIGDTVSFDRIKLGPPPTGSFSLYLLKEQIHATAFLSNSACNIISHPPLHINRSIHAYKHALLERIQSKCSKYTFALFSSIFLGNRNRVKYAYGTIKEAFHHWGIMHFLARSGLHLVLFVLLLQLLLNYFPIPFIAKQLIMLCTVALYALFSWSSISFARACSTFGWYTGSRICTMQIDVPTIVLLLSGIFLLHNPALLFFLDFQLSFGLTLVLSLTNQLPVVVK